MTGGGTSWPIVICFMFAGAYATSTGCVLRLHVDRFDFHLGSFRSSFDPSFLSLSGLGGGTQSVLSFELGIVCFLVALIFLVVLRELVAVFLGIDDIGAAAAATDEHPDRQAKEADREKAAAADEEEIAADPCRETGHQGASVVPFVSGSSSVERS